MLVCHHAEHELLEIPPEIFIVTVGYLDSPEVFFIVVIVTVDTETGSVSVQQVSTKLEFFHDVQNDPVEQISGAVIVNAVKGTKKDIIIQVFGGDPGTEQLFRRQVGEKPGEEVEAAFVETKPVQEHGRDNF